MYLKMKFQILSIVFGVQIAGCSSDLRLSNEKNRDEFLYNDKESIIYSNEELCSSHKYSNLMTNDDFIFLKTYKSINYSDITNIYHHYEINTDYTNQSNIFENYAAYKGRDSVEKILPEGEIISQFPAFIGALLSGLAVLGVYFLQSRREENERKRFNSIVSKNTAEWIRFEMVSYRQHFEQERLDVIQSATPLKIALSVADSRQIKNDDQIPEQYLDAILSRLQETMSMGYRELDDQITITPELVAALGSEAISLISRAKAFAKALLRAHANLDKQPQTVGDARELYLTLSDWEERINSILLSISEVERMLQEDAL